MIQATFRLVVDNDVKVNLNYTRTPTGTHSANTRISVGTSEEEYTIPADIGDEDEVWVINRDATNFITVGPVAEGTLAHPNKIYPGCLSVLSGQATLFLKADTAACDVEIFVHER